MVDIDPVRAFLFADPECWMAQPGYVRDDYLWSGELDIRLYNDSRIWILWTDRGELDSSGNVRVRLDPVFSLENEATRG